MGRMRGLNGPEDYTDIISSFSEFGCIQYIMDVQRKVFKSDSGLEKIALFPFRNTTREPLSHPFLISRKKSAALHQGHVPKCIKSEDDYGTKIDRKIER